MKWLLARLSEGSTWAGFAACIPSAVSLVADKNNPSAWAAFFGGLAAVLIKDKGSN